MQRRKAEHRMRTLSIQQITDSVRLTSFTDPSFKTMALSANLLLPLSQETAAKRGILPSLASRATIEFPNYTALNTRLSQLYGASVHSSVRKLGDYQVFGLAASGISSRYAFGGENMAEELCRILASMLFHPLLDKDGEFPEENFSQEKRQLLELKDAEFNDKVAYAHRRCEQLLFQGQPTGIDRYGSREDLAALKRQGLVDAWNEILDTARVELFVLGDCTAREAHAFGELFRPLGSPYPLDRVCFEKPGEIQRVTEEQPVTQSKLSLGFRVDTQRGERVLFQLMNAVLGGTASSKLFQNVREKESLCYYCSSGFSWSSCSLTIDSGVDTANMDRTEEAIFQQIEAMQRGEVTEEELLYAKLALKNSMGSLQDSLHSVENWYLGRTFDLPGQTPEQAAELLMSYTVEDVVEAARRLEPAVVYRLKGGEC